MVGIVILHFNAIEETRNCLNSFLKYLKKDEYFIVVVDNASINNSGIILKEEYKKYDNIFFILNKKNLGFSVGNNIGCEYANRFNPDFLVVINNDTYIEDEKFIKKIYEVYKKNKFDVLGPAIWNLHLKCNQNPYIVISSLEEVKKSIKEKEKDQTAFKYKYFIFKVIIRKIKNLLFKYSTEKIEFDPNNMKHGLNGAALIFSKKYIKKYKTIFEEATFMYSEEYFLNYRRIKDNLSFAYTPEILIYHKESVSTKNEFPNKYSKWKFQYRHQYLNEMKLKKLYEELEKNKWK